MFISTRKHLAIIKEIRTYWSNELYKARCENARLTAQLEAKASFKKTVLPAPVPAVERPKYAIVHLRTGVAFKTFCGETMLELVRRNTAEVEHLVTFTPPQLYNLSLRESWCADCLG